MQQASLLKSFKWKKPSKMLPASSNTQIGRHIKTELDNFHFERSGKKTGQTLQCFQKEQQ